MKKITLLLIAVLLVLSTFSCGLIKNDLESVKSMVAGPVRISAVTEKGVVIGFDLCNYESESIFTFNQPDTLTFLTVKKNNEGYFALYDGIETEIDGGSIMAADALDLAIETIRASQTCEKTIIEGQNVILFSIDGNNVLVYYNSEDKTVGKIISEAYGQLFTYEILLIESINI